MAGGNVGLLSAVALAINAECISAVPASHGIGEAFPPGPRTEAAHPGV